MKTKVRSQWQGGVPCHVSKHTALSRGNVSALPSWELQCVGGRELNPHPQTPERPLEETRGSPPPSPRAQVGGRARAEGCGAPRPVPAPLPPPRRPARQGERVRSAAGCGDCGACAGGGRRLRPAAAHPRPHPLGTRPPPALPYPPPPPPPAAPCADSVPGERWRRPRSRSTTGG